jgi:hypothetical protein
MQTNSSSTDTKKISNYLSQKNSKVSGTATFVEKNGK